MIKPFNEINWKPGAAELRKFAWSLIIGFPCIAIVFFLAKWCKTGVMPGAHGFLMLGGIGAGVGLVSLVVQPIARLLYPVWYFIAGCMGIVMGNLIFLVMFYGLFTPAGLVMRLLGRDPLNLKWKRNAATHWIDAPPAPPPARYFSQF